MIKMQRLVESLVELLVARGNVASGVSWADLQLRRWRKADDVDLFGWE
jgi:hypothetical protein